MKEISRVVSNYIDVSTGDEDESRRRRLLNIILVGIIFLTSLMAIISSLNLSTRGFLFTGSVIFLLINVVIFFINRHYSGSFASIVFLLILLISISFSDNPFEVVQGRSLFFFTIPIMISSVILRPSVSFFAAGFASLLIGIVAIQGGLPINSIAILGFFAIALVSWLSASSLENALRNLRNVNFELDARVDARTNDLAEANLRLQELDKLKSKFVSDVSHELRTPVSNLKIYLEMLQTGAGNQDVQDRYIKILHDEAERLSQLVSDVLDLSRLEMGAKKPIFEAIDLNELLQQSVLTNQMFANTRGLRINQLLADDLPAIQGNSDQLLQVLNNLIGNAVKYTEIGSIEVLSEFDKNAAQIMITVTDTGLGIIDEDIPHLFERFYRGKNASQSTIPGTGLGLAISKEIVELHNGVIKVANRENKGTVFTLLFPMSEL